MNKVIALAGITATFADRAASFGPEQSAKGAPIVQTKAVSAEAKSAGRTALQIEGLKQAGTSVDAKSVSSFNETDWTSNARLRG